jgi:hypothetical protein
MILTDSYDASTIASKKRIKDSLVIVYYPIWTAQLKYLCKATRAMNQLNEIPCLFNGFMEWRGGVELAMTQLACHRRGHTAETTR